MFLNPTRLAQLARAEHLDELEAHHLMTASSAPRAPSSARRRSRWCSGCGSARPCCAIERRRREPPAASRTPSQPRGASGVSTGTPDLVLSTAPFLRRRPPRRASCARCCSRRCWCCWRRAGTSASAPCWSWPPPPPAPSGTEWLFTRAERPSPLRDYSAVTTGVLLGLTLPPAHPAVDGVSRRRRRHRAGQAHLGRAGPEPLQPGPGGARLPPGRLPTAITTWAQPAARAAGWPCRSSLFARPHAPPRSTACPRPRRSASPSSSTS